MTEKDPPTGLRKNRREKRGAHRSYGGLTESGNKTLDCRVRTEGAKQRSDNTWCSLVGHVGEQVDDPDDQDESEGEFCYVLSSHLFELAFAETRASRDSVPPPTSSRKIRPSSILTSVRASCNVLQSPFFASVTI